MVKHTQTIRRDLPTNYLRVFDHFVGLPPKGLTKIKAITVKQLVRCLWTSNYVIWYLEFIPGMSFSWQLEKNN